MYCKCGGDTYVTDSRPQKDGSIRRRRQCQECGARFTTYEFLERDIITQRRDHKTLEEIRKVVEEIE